MSIDKMGVICQNASMAGEAVIQTTLDDKALAILSAATEVFSRYGFRRVSMEDIAREAGMSRAALYLHFKNKEDIFTQLVRFYFSDAAQNMATALAQGGTPATALQRAFAAKVGPTFRALLSSPHGDELLNAKSAIAPDIVQTCEALVSSVVTDWLEREASEGRVDLSATGGDAAAMTRLIIGALDGVVMSDAPIATIPERLDQLGAVMGRAITPH